MPMSLPFDIVADLDTPVSAYLKLRPFRPRFLLESVEGGVRLARYSFIGFGDCLELRLDRQGLAINGAVRPRPADRGELLAALRKALLRAPRPRPTGHGLPLGGGLVGFSAYDLVRYFESLPRPSRNGIEVPEACYLAPASLLVFDHLTRGVTLLHDGDEMERQLLKREIVAALAGPLPQAKRRFQHSPAKASLGREDFIDAVGRVQSHIVAGDVYQLVLSVRFDGSCELDPFQAYRALRLLNPSPYMYYCEAGGLAVVGSSPEALVRLNGRHAELRPIAGTLARGADAAEDEARAERLLADPKENAEHVMLVDLARNDLGRVARAGSVRIDPYRLIERYSHVMHIVSHVEGKIRPGMDAFDLMRATFPAGTVSGAPKVRAMEIIEELEGQRRGIYAGAVGYFSYDGSMDTCITIRTMLVQDDTVYVQAGAGIVADSDPATEHQESLNKASALAAAIEQAEHGLI